MRAGLHPTYRAQTKPGQCGRARSCATTSSLSPCTRRSREPEHHRGLGGANNFVFIFYGKGPEGTSGRDKDRETLPRRPRLNHRPHHLGRLEQEHRRQAQPQPRQQPQTQIRRHVSRVRTPRILGNLRTDFGPGVLPPGGSGGILAMGSPFRSAAPPGPGIPRPPPGRRPRRGSAVMEAV